MGCVVTRSSEPHIVAKRLKLPQHPNNTECQTDSDHTIKGEQQANQMGNSGVNSEPGIFKQLKTAKSIKVPTLKRPDGRIRKGSERPSLQDFSLKNSLEGSFEKDKDKDKEKEKEALNVSHPSPSEEDSSRNNSRNPSLAHSNRRSSISLLAKPSNFKITSPSLAANIADSGQKDKDGLLWSFGPGQENHFNPTFAAVGKESSVHSKAPTQGKLLKRRNSRRFQSTLQALTQ